MRTSRVAQNDQPVFQALTIALQVIMVHKLANAGPQRIFTEENHLLQAAFLNVPYKSFAIGNKFGDRGGNFTDSMPTSASKFKNSCVYKGSRS